MNGNDNTADQHVAYTLDTNAFIYFLKAEREAGPRVRELILRAATLYVSTVTEIELFGFPRISPEEMHDIEQLLTKFTSIPLASRLARFAGGLRRFYGLKVADSAIAATALATGSSLVTRNVRDFRRIPDLRLMRI